MGKQTHTEKLQAQIDEALRLNEEHADASDKARDQYDAAVTGGDMEQAHQHQQEAARLETLARSYGDRVKALEAQLPDARAKDAEPQHKQATKALADAVSGIEEAEARAQEAAAAYAEAMREMDRHREAFGSAAASLSSLARAHGFTAPPVTMAPLSPRLDLIDEARRHGRMRDMLNQTMTDKRVNIRRQAKAA